MTYSIRKILEKKVLLYKRIIVFIWIVLFTEMIVVIADCFRVPNSYEIIVVATSLALWVIFAIVLLRMQFGGVRCPCCHVNLSGICGETKIGFSIFNAFPKEFMFCPGCGKNIDESIND